MLEVAARFQHHVDVILDSVVPGQVLAAYGIENAHIEALSGGRTNRTLRARGTTDLVLQHVRGGAQRDVLGVMENLVRVTSHLEWRRLVDGTGESWYPLLVPSANGKPFVMSDTGDLWRAFIYRPGVIVRSSQPRHTLTSAAALYGRFTAATADLGGPPLIATAPGFHDLDLAWQRFQQDLAHAPPARRARIEAQLRAIERQRAALEGRCVDDGLRSAPDRVVHNDTKLSNVLFDRPAGRAIAVLDLDLVMMGPVWHDVGDLVRSASWYDGPTPRCSPELFESVVAAYVGAAARTLTDDEIATFAVAGARLSFELGIRYLNDHLRTEPILRVDGVDGHLERGLANLRLAAEMLGAYDVLRRTVDELIAGRADETRGIP